MSFEELEQIYIGEIRNIVRELGPVLTDNDISFVLKEARRRHKDKLEIPFKGLISTGKVQSIIASECEAVSGTSFTAKRVAIAKIVSKSFELNENETSNFMKRTFGLEDSLIESLRLLCNFKHKKLVKLLCSCSDQNINSPQNTRFFDVLVISGAIVSNKQEEERMKNALDMFADPISIYEEKIFVYDNSTRRHHVFVNIGPAIAIIATIWCTRSPKELNEKLVKLGYKIS